MIVNKTRKRVIQIVQELLMVGLSLLIVVPLLIMILGSFKTSAEASRFSLALPDKWMFENYAYVFKYGNVARSFTNTVIITAFSTFFAHMFSTMGSYILARRRTKAANRLYVYFLTGMIVPFQIVTTFALLRMLTLNGSFLGVILIFISTNLAYNTIVYTGFFRAVPRELDEAAFVDGCKPFRTYLTIILPLSKPIIFTQLVITMMGVWNDFMIPLFFLNSSKKWTMSLTIYTFFGQESSNWNYVFADVVIMVAPIIIIYIYAQKFIVSGLTSGAVKG